MKRSIRCVLIMDYILITILTLMLIGCSNPSQGQNRDDNLKIKCSPYKQYEYNSGDTAVEIVDPETGVHYLVIDEYYGTAVTPMYDADGNIKTSK